MPTVGTVLRSFINFYFALGIFKNTEVRLHVSKDVIFLFRRPTTLHFVVCLGRKI